MARQKSKLPEEQVSKLQSKNTSKISSVIKNQESRLKSHYEGPHTSVQQEEQTESEISYLKARKGEDIINGPDYSPQQHSFHLNTSKSVDCIKKPCYSFKEALKIKF